MEPVDYLSLDEVLPVCDRLGFAVRDPGLLEAALARPMTTVLGQDAYAEFATKVAALMDSVNRNHPLVDGNKRLSWILAVVFAGLNGFNLEASVDDAERFVVSVSTGDLALEEITEWLSMHLSKTKYS